MNTRLRGKVALVTGAATGIGAAVARRFAAEGATTYATWHSEGKGNYAGDGADAPRYVRLDVTDEAQWLALRQRIGAAHGRLDILVNNAGIVLDRDDIEATDLANWRRTLDANATGVFLGCHTLFDLLKQSAAASIVNVASSIVTRPDVMVAYAASKAAVWGLTRSVALYCGRHDLPIRCNAVLPGGVETEMLRDFIAAAQDPDAVRRGSVGKHLIKRFAEPDEVASLIAYLASDEAGFVTGGAFPIDGGLTLS